MIGIYKITNPIGRIYVGQSMDIKRRFNTYKYKDCREQPKLYNSFLRYGINTHLFEVIEECDIERLNDRERYWQEMLDSVSFGLNCCYVNSTDKTGKHSSETKLKISASAMGNKYTLGYKHREESKRKISASNMGKRKGFVISHKQRIDHSKKMSGGGNSRAVIVINVENGVFNDCIKDAALMYGINTTTLRSRLSRESKNKTPLRSTRWQ